MEESINQKSKHDLQLQYHVNLRSKYQDITTPPEVLLTTVLTDFRLSFNYSV